MTAPKNKDPEAPYSTPLPGAKPGQNIAKGTKKKTTKKSGLNGPPSVVAT